jgi:hypothetical protein
MVRNVAWLIPVYTLHQVSFSAIEPLSRIIVSLYAKRTIRTDVLVGKQEITCEPQRGPSIS